MDSRFRLTWILSAFTLALSMTGCGDAGPPPYAKSPELQALVTNRPVLERKIHDTVTDLFGANPYQIKLPKGTSLAAGVKGTGIRDAGKFLASHYQEGAAGAEPVTTNSAGGAYLYRKHCLHCHGISGDGNGPTGPYLYPRPRDFRNGVFKFTSTKTGSKPTRDDLYKTIKNGLHGTSMPSFDALMNEEEIQEVIDYTIFLSIRGETELRMIKRAQSFADEQLVEESGVKDISEGQKLEEILDLQEGEGPEKFAQEVAKAWVSADADKAMPTAPRVGAGDAASIARGKAHFVKNCVECHGYRADGTGGKYIDREIWDKVVFRSNPLGETLSAQFEVLLNREKQDHAIMEYKKTLKYPVAHGTESAEHHTGEAGLSADDFLSQPGSKVLNLLSDPKQYTEAPHCALGGEGAVTLQKFKDGLAEFKKNQSAGSFAKTFFPNLMKTFPRFEEKAFQDYLPKALLAWESSRDEVWHLPLRPANLNTGVYKGGRRPLDLYLRIANGINSSTMPAHYNPASPTSLQPADIWDLVNFVTVLPDNPRLLDDAQPPATPPASSPGHELPKGPAPPVASR